MSSGKTSPLTFDLQQDLLEKLKLLQRRTGARSLSEVVRYAVSSLKVSELDLGGRLHQQISVRLSDDLRQRLVRLSKQKK
ncbi:MAG: ribbon-helix-helix protein, CopG family, partial [Verrucomicrobiota bacterium]